MAELEARREARRRKILENSEKRLNKISGVEQKSTKSELDGIKLSSSYTENNEALLASHITSNEGCVYDRVSSAQNHSSNPPAEIRTIFENSSMDENESVFNYSIENSESRFQNIHIFVLPIILSVILISLDLLKVDSKAIYLNKIFIPLLTYEIIEYFVGFSVDSAPNFLTSLLVLTNVRNRFLTVYIQYIQYFVKILQDLMVYFVVFTVSHRFLTILLF